MSFITLSPQLLLFPPIHVLLNTHGTAPGLRNVCHCYSSLLPPRFFSCQTFLCALNEDNRVQLSKCFVIAETFLTGYLGPLCFPFSICRIGLPALLQYLLTAKGDIFNSSTARERTWNRTSVLKCWNNVNLCGLNILCCDSAECKGYF